MSLMRATCALHLSLKAMEAATSSSFVPSSASSIRTRAAVAWKMASSSVSQSASDVMGCMSSLENFLDFL